MLASQRLDLEVREVRQALNAFPEDGEDSKRDELTAKYSTLESKYRAAIITEDTTETESTTETTAEGRDFGRLRARASISDFVLEVAGERDLEGASKEYRQAVLGDNIAHYMPLEMLAAASQSEYRADAVSNQSDTIEGQMSIAQRVFPRSSIAYLGVSTPTVPVGAVSYPRLNAGTSADIRSDGIEVDGSAATLEIKEINPIRLTASYTFGVESLVRVAGWEEALRVDLQSTLQDKRDKLALNGQAAVASTSPAVVGIIGSLTDPGDPSAVADYTDYLEAYDSMVDGQYAVSVEEVRLLVNKALFVHAMGLPIATNRNGGLLRDRLPMDRFRVSANMPASTNANIGKAIAYAAGAPVRGYYMPQWSGVQMVVDPFTKAKSGERVLTAIMVTAFDQVDGRGYALKEFQTA